MKQILIGFFGYFLLLSVGSVSAATVTPAEAGMDALMAQVGTGVDIRFIDSMNIVNADLLVIDTDTELDKLFALGSVAPSLIVNMFFVDEVNSCGGPDMNIIGCADRPGNNIVVENVGAIQAETNVHELGHNFGLPHLEEANNIMMTGEFGNTAFNANQIATILNSPLVQTGPGGERFVQIKPFLVTAVPLPATLWLMLSGLGILGVTARPKQVLT